MVRTTVACVWCRRSKIKCVHNGSSPCRACVKAERTAPGDCILSGPFDSAARHPRVKRRGIIGNESQVSGNAANSAGTPSVTQSPHPSQPLQDIIDQTPHSVIVKTAGLFRRKFPELPFLHLPTFTAATKNHGVQVAAMLAACRRFMPGSKPDVFAAEDYANYARECLSRIPMDAPNLTTVQALLTMSMYEWGSGNGYGAWMYSGMAAKMMQCLGVFMADHALTETDRRIQNRTFWGCFIMDRLVSCGRTQPATLPLDRMSIPLPSGDQDFAFGTSPSSSYTLKHLRDNPSISRSLGTIDNYYSVLIRGFDIWAQALEFVIDGGRKRPGMANPENCPWVHGLEVITQRCLKYPSSPVSAHVSLGQDESFAYVNLVYYLSILFLNREYIPLLPNLNSEPQGPVDLPALQAVAPQNWWSDRARELFYSAAAITEIIQELEDLGCPLLTPFPGFCVFSAATMNVYVAEFPRMNLGGSPSAAAMVQVNIVYLDEFRGLWKMGNRWWSTIKRTQRLYQGAVADRARFHGKTRIDFLALEASIHDCSGTSPTHDDSLIQETSRHKHEMPQQLALYHAAAISLQELFVSGVSRPTQRQQTFEVDHMQVDNTIGNDHWNELWPMWGEFNFNPI